MQLLQPLRKPNERLFREAIADRPPTPLQTEAVKSGSVEPLFVGNFLLESKLDDSFGPAFLARDLPTGTLWVVRRLPKPLQMGRLSPRQLGLSSPGTRGRSTDILTGRLRHVDGTSYLVRPFLPGRTLKDLVSKRGSLPSAPIVRLGSRLADILTHYSDDPRLRLISPDQVVLTSDGQWKLVDLEWNEMMVRFATRPGMDRHARYTRGFADHTTWQSGTVTDAADLLCRILRFAIGDADADAEQFPPGSPREKRQLHQAIERLRETPPPDLADWKKQLSPVDPGHPVAGEKEERQGGRSQEPRHPVRVYELSRLAWLFGGIVLAGGLAVAVGWWTNNREVAVPSEKPAIDPAEADTSKRSTIYADESFQVP